MFGNKRADRVKILLIRSGFCLWYKRWRGEGPLPFPDGATAAHCFSTPPELALLLEVKLRSARHPGKARG
ncbi:hypothetical protein HS125_15050 [bacterium]|nr:hypothetical protein [bacterium]